MKVYYKYITPLKLAIFSIALIFNTGKAITFTDSQWFNTSDISYGYLLKLLGIIILGVMILNNILLIYFFIINVQSIRNFNNTQLEDEEALDNILLRRLLTGILEVGTLLSCIIMIMFNEISLIIILSVMIIAVYTGLCIFNNILRRDLSAIY